MRGMTLIEVLVAVTVFGLVAVPLVQMFSGGTSASIRQRYFSIANKLLLEKIEELRHTKLNYLVCEDPENPKTCKVTPSKPTLKLSGDFKGEGLGGYKYPKEYERFRWETEITGDSWDPVTGQLDLAHAKVTVFWKVKYNEGEKKVEGVVVLKRLGTISAQ